MSESVTVEKLKHFVEKYPLDEKILIVPSFVLGGQYLDRLAINGTPTINLRLATLWTLAMTAIENKLAEKNTEIFGSVRIRLLVENIVERLAAENKLKYFVPIQQMPGVTESLYRAIGTLRQAGIEAEKLDIRASETPDKLSDVKLILDNYEKDLRESNGLDISGIIAEANKQEKLNELFPETKFAVLAEHTYSKSEMKLIKAIAQNRLTVVPHDAVKGLKRPQHYNFENKIESYIPSAYSYLYASASAPENAGTEIDCFYALGTHNEIREVFRRILESSVLLDSVEVLIPEASDYLPKIKETAERFGIPVTFGTGILSSMTSPGRALRAFLDWISGGFTSRDLRFALHSGLLYPVSESLQNCNSTGHSLARTLAAAGISWGAERYAPAFNTLISRIRKKIKNATEDDEQDTDSLERTVKEAEILAQFTNCILEPFKDATGNSRILLSAVAKICRQIINSFCIVVSEEDILARGALSSRLEELSEIAEEKVSLENVKERILLFCGDIRVSVKAPESGALHVDSYIQGGRSGRKWNFIIGADSQHFPGHGLQDSVLLDMERESISDDLFTSQNRISANVYGLAVTFAGLRGRITISYSMWDPRQNKDNFPSSLVLQAYRLASRKQDADYEELKEALGSPTSYIPASDAILLDDTDIWLSKMWRKERLSPAMESVKIIYPALSAGIEAEKQRNSFLVTPYDGLIPEIQIDFTKIIHSATSIEMLALCPRKYFFRYILMVKPPDEDIPEPGQWLDPMNRGSLMHEVFCRFYRELRDTGIIRPKESHRRRLH
ncbi:MAG: PD-(D/E)XK nuclease family protein, partial [Planctomycetota bacterium]